jgi:osmoprotectant transport system substrate-binding protein
VRASRFRWWAALALALAIVAGACGDDDTSTGDTTAPGGTGDVDRGAITVGSTDFTEQFIVASMYGQVLEAAGYDVTVRSNLGTRDIVFPSLESGELDLVAEYVGTLVEYLNEGAGEATSDLDATKGLLDGYLEERDLVALAPAPAEDKNALAVTRETAEELGLETISDLVDVAGGLRFGGPPECPERPLCLLGLTEVYGLEFREFVPLDAGGPLTMEALARGDIDVALVFSSDGQIAARDFVVLEDDQGLQPAENLVPVIRADALNEEIRSLLDGVSAVLTTEKLSELNRQVNVDLVDPDDAARDFLVAQGLLEE